MASPEYEAFYKKAIRRSIPSDLPIEEVRASFERLMAGYPPPEQVRFEKFTIGKIPACWVFAPQATREKILLFFHGGSYNAGSIRSHSGLLGRLSAASNCAILAIEYRLAPEHPHPEGLEDALAAYLWLLHHPYPPAHLAVGGISAGAGLALALLLRLKLENRSMPKAAVCLSPWIDLALKGETIRTNLGKDILKPDRLAWSAEKYAAGRDLKDPFVSPLYGDLNGLPRLFIQTGMRELLYSEALLLAEKAKKQGVAVELDSWPEMFHAWQLFFPEFPESQEATVRIGDFLKRSFQSKE
jgi:acetyl esterase/lipase